MAARYRLVLVDLPGHGKSPAPTMCDYSYLTALAVPVRLVSSPGPLIISVGKHELLGFDKMELVRMLEAQGLPLTANSQDTNGLAVTLLLMSLVLLAALIYGPLGAYLTEQFPVHVRYSAVSVSLQFVNGWIGGFGPFIATALVSMTGNIYHGLWYPIIVSALAVVVTLSTLRPASNFKKQAPSSAT